MMRKPMAIGATRRRVDTELSRGLIPRLTCIALLVFCAPAHSQDIAPAIDPIENARGLHQRSIMGAHARDARGGRAKSDSRTPRPGTAELQAQACANHPVYRRQYGANHPQVLQLEALCKQAGY